MRNWFLVLATLIGSAVPALASDDAAIDFFEKKIRPALVTYCYECHSAAAKSPGGGLLLDHRAGLLTGGDSGPAIVPGKPDESLLLNAIRYRGDIQMPPKSRLPEAVIGDFETWIGMGAVDPREEPPRTVATPAWDGVMRERANWWSLHPVQRPARAAVRHTEWTASPVDQFIAAKLEEQQLEPGAPTDPRTFARRLSLVLTGLPPAIEQVEQFVAACRVGGERDPLPAAVVESLVDSLLRSPHFGEQWARHWMDVVRFSETHGNEWNYEVHHAWRYRDYLIRAFNQDVPWDQLIREQIAGDLLAEPRWNESEQFNESVIGTGFYRFGEVNHDDCISLRSLGYDLADNQLDTLTKAFQATTVACARCHNHKLDAISMEDYYGLLAIIRSTRNVSHGIDAPAVNRATRDELKSLKSRIRAELGQIWRQDAERFAAIMRAASAIRTQQPDAAALAQGLDRQRLDRWVAALAEEKSSFEDPLDLWRRVVHAEVVAAADAPPTNALAPAKSRAAVWKEAAEQFQREETERTQFNQSRFETYADFRQPGHADWWAGGQAMQDEASRSGDFIVQLEGDAAVHAILPAGRYTHSLSSKLNATLRSPVLRTGKKFISFQVLGQRSSAVRLVSNNCQLNYANYRALTSPEFQWVTFSPPDDRESLRTYAELMTMFDNPKFPDQLAPLGGDPGNYKMPWEKAAENPRSFFGITQVVLHDTSETPRTTVASLRSLYQPPLGHESSAEVLTEVIDRTVARLRTAIDAWCADTASDDDVRWLDVLLRRGLIGNQLADIGAGQSLIAEYRACESRISIPRVSIGVSDGGPSLDQPIFVRGDCLRPGATVPPSYLEVLAPGGLGQPRRPFDRSGSGRLQLAERIACADNPLTARVMVNRIWHHLFGTGLVRTVDDFGHVGERPSHPELLDELADQFVRDGWSVKRLIRSLVLTRTFQLSNLPSPQSLELDPQNRWLQHYPARRMEAESVRDVILVASGRLDPTLYGASVQPYRDKEYADRRLFPGPLDGSGRRSIYIKNNLMESPKFLAAFNLPGGKVTQGRRDVTNVPAQALALLNDPFVVQQAEVWSKHLLARSDDTIDGRVDAMFRAALGRSATREERDRFTQAATQLAELYRTPPSGVLGNEQIWKDLAHALFNMSEMIYIP